LGLFLLLLSSSQSAGSGTRIRKSSGGHQVIGLRSIEIKYQLLFGFLPGCAKKNAAQRKKKAAENMMMMMVMMMMVM
jgi:hypothetical protein